MSPRALATVVGVFANLSARSRTEMPRMKDRRFVTVTSATIPVLRRHLHPEIPEAAWSGTGSGVGADLLATWRGLDFLVRRVRSIPGVKVKVLDASLADLLRDLHQASEFDQSALFKFVYREGLGTFGGEPFTFLVLPQTLSLDDVNSRELATKMSEVAAAAGAPLLSSVAPDSVFLPDWSALNPDFRPEWVLRPWEPEGKHDYWWNDLQWEGNSAARALSDSAYLFLVLSRVREARPAELEPDSPAVWLDPVLLTAVQVCRWVGRAWQDEGELGGPEDQPGAPAVMDHGEPLEVEHTFDDATIDRLRQAGLNVVRLDGVSASHGPTSLVSAARLIRARCAPDLATVLGCTRLSHELRVAVRKWSGSYPVASFSERCGDWLLQRGARLSPDLLLSRLIRGAHVRAGKLVVSFDETRDGRHVRSHPACSFTHPIWPQRPTVPTRTTAPLQLHVIADIGLQGREPGPPARRWPSGSWDTAEFLVESLKPVLQLPQSQGGGEGTAPPGRIEMMSLSSFEPSGIARAVRPDLANRRDRLEKLAGFVDISRHRVAALPALAAQRGAVRGLSWKLEALEEARQLGDAAPVDAAEAFADLQIWVRGTGTPPTWVGEALVTLQHVLDEQGDGRPVGVDGGAEGVVLRAIRDLDRHIGGVLGPVFGDPVFRALEGVWRGLELVLRANRPDHGQPGMVTMSVRSLDWRSLQGVAAREHLESEIATELRDNVRLVRDRLTLFCTLVDLRAGLSPTAAIVVRGLQPLTQTLGVLLLMALPADIDELTGGLFESVLKAAQEHENVVVVSGEFETRPRYRASRVVPGSIDFDEPGEGGPVCSVAYRLIEALAQTPADSPYLTVAEQTRTPTDAPWPHSADAADAEVQSAGHDVAAAVRAIRQAADEARIAATRELIRDAAGRLGYHCESLGRALRVVAPDGSPARRHGA